MKFEQFLIENEYELDDVYNGDEGGLMFRSLPNQTLVTANDVERNLHPLVQKRLFDDR